MDSGMEPSPPFALPKAEETIEFVSAAATDDELEGKLSKFSIGTTTALILPELPVALRLEPLAAITDAGADAGAVAAVGAFAVCGCCSSVSGSRLSV